MDQIIFQINQFKRENSFVLYVTSSIKKYIGWYGIKSIFSMTFIETIFLL